MVFDSVFYFASLLLQAASLAFALRMTRVTPRRTAWMLMFVALLGMTIFRVVGLLVSGRYAVWKMDAAAFQNFSAFASFVISAFLFASLFAIRQITVREQAATIAKRESEDRLRVGLAAGNTGTWDWDILNNHVHWSDSIYKFHGVAPGQFGGRVEDFTPLIHPDDRDRVSAAIQSALKGESAYHTEYRALLPDGGTRWLSTMGLVNRDATGKPTRMLGAASDISERKRGEEELANSQQRLKALFDNTQDAILLTDDAANYIDVNAAASALTGYSREELLRMSVWDLTPLPNRADGEALWKQFIAAGSQAGDYLLQRKDGSSVEVEFRAAASILPSVHLSALRDVTVRNRDQAALRQSVARHRALLESALDAILSIDRDGKIIEWNPAATRIFGYSRAEVLGSDMASLIIPPAMRDAHHVGLTHYLATGEGPVLDKHIELTALRRDRSEFPIELSITRIPADGPPTFKGQIRDISDRKRAEEALRESEERLRLGLEAGNTGTWDWDIVNNRVTWSDRAYGFYGLRPGDFNGGVEAFAKLVHPDDAGRVNDLIQTAITERTPYTAEFRVVHPNGEIRWISTNGKVHYGADGKPLRMLGATTDVTSRRSAEAERDRLLDSERAARAEAERASRMKDEFLATLSHELRTPLNAILGWSQILRDAPPSDDDLSKGLETIERNARAQTQIIEDLLDMSRIISGNIRLDVQRVHLAGVIEAALETVTPAAMAKEIRLVPILDPSAAAVSGDPGRLQQIFWNLLFNAIKFTPKGGRIQIVLERVNSHLEISVIDTGQGIDPEFLPHVFDRFRQADASTTRKHGGLGLGLAIVKQLVELHGGTVQARSAGTGSGATFTVTLPLTPLHQPAEQESERRHPSAPGAQRSEEECIELNGVRVLVVDDEPDARALVHRLLANCKAEVFTAASADEGIELLNRQPVDVLISDIGMPQEDGYSFIRRVRHLHGEAARHVPAVALTAYARSEDRKRAILAGFHMHLSKPVDPSELIAIVASLAARR